MSLQLRSSCSLALALLTVSVASADPVVTAYSHTGDDLYRWLLTGDSPVLPQAVGATGVSGVFALAAGPGETLFAAVDNALEPDELWRIDRHSLSSVAVGELGVELDSLVDLASDGAGGLWLASAGTLHSVDTLTGEATAVGGPSELSAIAFAGGTLHGITGSAAADDWTLVTIDPVTGEPTAVSDLEFAPSFNGGLLVGLAAMDFDDLGGLWVLAVYFAIVAPPIPWTQVNYFAEPASGPADAVSAIAETLYWKPLAITGTTVPAVEVPALDAGGLAVLALGLAAAAALTLRRRRSAARPSPAAGTRP